MPGSKPHSKIVEEQFGVLASEYQNSKAHAGGKDLTRLSGLLKRWPQAMLLDLGCGAGHVSYTAAPLVKKVTAYDLSGKMLEVVMREADKRGYHNVEVWQGMAEMLPFPDKSYDIVASRYSAHHWRDAGLAVREAARVLNDHGLLVLVDIISPGYALLDSYLQAMELMRDKAHVRNYALNEWTAFIEQAGLAVRDLSILRLRLDFKAWTRRMRTPPNLARAIRELQKHAPREVISYFQINADGSFSVDVMLVLCIKQ